MPFAEMVPWVLITLLYVLVLTAGVWLVWSVHRIRIAAEEILSELRQRRTQG